MNGASIGPGRITRLIYRRPMLFADMRPNLRAGFTHALRISYDIKTEYRDTLRMTLAIACAVVVSHGVMSFTDILMIYNNSGLSSDSWCEQTNAQIVLRGAAALI